MNNLVIASFVVAVSSGFWWNGHRQLVAANAATGNTQAQIQHAASAAKQAEEENGRLEKLFIVQQQSIEEIRQRTKNIVTNVVLEARGELTPQKEGFWPDDKPYFYLSKRRLAGLDYWPLSDADDRLSSAAVSVFGMSPEEATAANTAYAMMRRKIQEAELAMAVPTNTPTMFEGWAGTKKSIFLDAVPTETLQALNQEFRSSLAQVLGEARAALLTARIDENIRDSAYSAGRARTLTLIRSGDKISLAEIDANGNMNNSSSTDPEGRDIVPRFVRHLFEE